MEQPLIQRPLKQLVPQPLEPSVLNYSPLDGFFGPYSYAERPKPEGFLVSTLIPIWSQVVELYLRLPLAAWSGSALGRIARSLRFVGSTLGIIFIAWAVLGSVWSEVPNKTSLPGSEDRTGIVILGVLIAIILVLMVATGSQTDLVVSPISAENVHTSLDEMIRAGRPVDYTSLPRGRSSSV